ncbi:unnamed protein product [Paramecium sonneborni]|uniref:Uncharacterized protein n=1 Tax=Paramecium sonneborni TaxID=65129 RepID=A0A8S1PJP0_9CILI|nr:unnamed protein product [Paramecium sonneborni]
MYQSFRSQQKLYSFQGIKIHLSFERFFYLQLQNFNDWTEHSLETLRYADSIEGQGIKISIIFQYT